jgi:hypothetical protein
MTFIKSVFGNTLPDDLNMIGYTGNEIEKIERLYDIVASNQLRSFFLEMGKSDGGAIGDYFIPLYRPTWRVRQHILFQMDFFNRLQEENFFEYLYKPFVISLVSETQYYFLETSSHGDEVFHYDENNSAVTSSSLDLVNFLKSLVLRNSGKIQKSTVGNLLEI